VISGYGHLSLQLIAEIGRSAGDAVLGGSALAANFFNTSTSLVEVGIDDATHTGDASIALC
jgi:hypothetical protein